MRWGFDRTKNNFGLSRLGEHMRYTGGDPLAHYRASEVTENKLSVAPAEGLVSLPRHNMLPAPGGMEQLNELLSKEGYLIAPSTIIPRQEGDWLKRTDLGLFTTRSRTKGELVYGDIRGTFHKKRPRKDAQGRDIGIEFSAFGKNEYS